MYLLMSWCQKRYAAKGRRHRMARPTPPSIPPSHGPPPSTHTRLPCQEIHGGSPLLENSERATVSMQPSFSRVSLPRKVLLSIHGLPTLRLVLSLSDETATHENSKGKETTPPISLPKRVSVKPGTAPGLSAHGQRPPSAERSAASDFNNDATSSSKSTSNTTTTSPPPSTGAHLPR